MARIFGGDMSRSIRYLLASFCLSACSSSPTSEWKSEDYSLSKTNSRIVEITDIDTPEPSKLENGLRVVSVNVDSGTPRQLENPVRPITKGPVLSNADLIFQAKEVLNNLFPDLSFRLQGNQRSKLFDYVSFQQTFMERDIVGAEVTLRLDRSGQWLSLRSSLIQNGKLEAINFPTQFRELAADKIPFGHQIFGSQEVIYPKLGESGFDFYVSKMFQIYNPQAQRAYQIWMDQASGEIVGTYIPEDLFEDDMLLSVQGSIAPDRPEQSLLEEFLPFVTFKVGNSKYQADLFGKFDFKNLLGEKALLTLENPYLSVVDNKGLNNEMQLTFSEDLRDSLVQFDDHSSPEERNIYYWVMKARSYLSENLEFNAMNRQIVAMANFGLDLDNAFFDPLLYTLAFGAGKSVFKNTAMARDIILHEFFHSVTHEIYGIKINYEFSAMNEAFSDYFAATITGDPMIGNGAMIGNVPYLRTVKNTYQYDTFFEGKYFHRDGQLFSGALWDLRESLGHEKADRLIHEARLARGSNIREFYRDLRMADEANEDGDPLTYSKNARTIREAFNKHGLHSQARFEQVTDPFKSVFGPKSSCWGNELPEVTN